MTQTEPTTSYSVLIRDLAQDVANLMMPELVGEMREHCRVLLLDTSNQVMSVRIVAIGSLNASVVHPREVFRDAITQAAAGIIAVHNHPSGDPSPSPEDVAITKRLAEAGKIVGIEVVDHVVIGDGCFVSLKERGLL